MYRGQERDMKPKKMRSITICCIFVLGCISVEAFGPVYREYGDPQDIILARDPGYGRSGSYMIVEDSPPDQPEYHIIHTGRSGYPYAGGDMYGPPPAPIQRYPRRRLRSRYGRRRHLRYKRQAGPMPFHPGMHHGNMPFHPLSRMGPGGMFNQFSNRFNRRPTNDQFSSRNSMARGSRSRQTGSNRELGNRMYPIRQTASTNRLFLLRQNYAGRNRGGQMSGRWSQQNGNMGARNNNAQRRFMNNKSHMNLQGIQQQKIQSSTQMRQAQPLQRVPSAKPFSHGTGSGPQQQQTVGQKKTSFNSKGRQSNGRVGSQNQIQGNKNLFQAISRNQFKNQAAQKRRQPVGSRRRDMTFTKSNQNIATPTQSTQADLVSRPTPEKTPIGNPVSNTNPDSSFQVSSNSLSPSDTFSTMWSEQTTYQEVPLSKPTQVDVSGPGVNSASSESAVSQSLDGSSQTDPRQTQGNINDIAGISGLKGPRMNTVDSTGFNAIAPDANGVLSQASAAQKDLKDPLGPNGFSSFGTDTTGMSSQTGQSQTNVNGVVDPNTFSSFAPGANLMSPDAFSTFATGNTVVSSQASPSKSNLNGVTDPLSPNGLASFSAGANGASFINNDPGHLPVDGTSVAGNGFNNMNTVSSLMDMGPMTAEPQMNGPYDPAVADVGNQGLNMQGLGTLYPPMDTGNQGFSMDQNSQVLQGSSITAESQMNGPYDPAVADVGNQGLNNQGFDTLYPPMDTGNQGFSMDQNSQVFQGSSTTAESQMNRPYDPAVVDVGNQGLNMQGLDTLYPPMDTGNQGFSMDQNSQVLQGSSTTAESQMNGPYDPAVVDVGNQGLNMQGLDTLYPPMDTGNQGISMDQNSQVLQGSSITSESQMNGPYDPVVADVGNQGLNMQGLDTLYPPMDTGNQGFSMDQNSQVLQGSSITAESQINGPYDPSVVDVGNQGVHIQDFNGLYTAMDRGNQGFSADPSSQVLQGSSQPVDSSLQSTSQAGINGLSAGNQDILFQDPQLFDVNGQMSVYSNSNSPFMDVRGESQTGVVDPFSSNGQFETMNDPTYATGMQGDLASNTVMSGTGNPGFDTTISGSSQANGNFIM